MSTIATPSNRYIKIEDLNEKINVEENNIIIVEDDDDTKKTTVREFKKVFAGDFSEPSRELFYSTSKIKEIQDDINLVLSSKATNKDLNALITRVNNLVLSASIEGKDPEIVEARGDNATLNERFIDERKISDTSYLEKITKTVTGNTLELNGHTGSVEITPLGVYSNTTTISPNSIVVQSKNILDVDTINHTGHSSESIKCYENGFEYLQTLNLTTDEHLEIKFNVGSGYPGHYYLKANVFISDAFMDIDIILRLHHTDGTVTEIPYSHQTYLEFDSDKPFNEIGFVYNTSNIIHNTRVDITNIILSQYDISEYVQYYFMQYSPELGESFFVENNDYVFYCLDSNCILSIKYTDHENTTQSIINRLNNIELVLGESIDKCGLMENYGVMQLFESCEITSSEASGTVTDGEYQFIRNGIHSKKIIIGGSGNLVLKQILEIPPEDVHTASLCFYIDKTTYTEFREDEGIEFILCSDIPSNPNMNYYSYLIKKDEMVQGWNTVCRNIDDFNIVGNPDLYKLKTIGVIVQQNEYLADKAFYLNVGAFNQRMKPTILLNIEEFQQNGTEYIYPYLAKFNIPATIYMNSSRSLTSEEYDGIIKQRVDYGWDIGGNGCHPNKELLLETNNYRNQYQALKKTKTYLQDNVVYNPIAYSAPYGTIVPITVPILKDLGFKIAKATSTGYISTFTKNDFVIPSQLISNIVTADEIKARIDYAIDNGLSIAFTIRDVTEYGDELNATKVIFESIIDYINERVEEGTLQCLSLSEFYNRCVND